MKRVASVIAGILMLGINTPSMATGDAAVSFKSLVLGSSLKDFVETEMPAMGDGADLGAYIDGPSNEDHLKYLLHSSWSPESGGPSIAGVPSRAASVEFDADPDEPRNRKLSAITVDFNKSSFEIVLAAMESKYGQPTLGGLENYENGFGARLLGRKANWRLGKDTIELTECVSGTSGLSRARFFNARLRAIGLRERNTAAAKTAAQDL